MSTIKVLSLGAGVQSTVLALMACDGTLPGLDAAVFADTGWEPPAVYQQVERLRTELDRAGIPLHVVSSGNLRVDTLDPAHRFVSVPYYTKGPCRICDGAGSVTDLGVGAGAPLNPEPWMFKLAKLLGADDINEAVRMHDRYTGTCPACDGSGESDGMGRRQCTSEYKLKPIKVKVRELLGYPHPTPVPRDVFAEQWIGFSTDEVGRVRDRLDVNYSRPRYPLLELGMSRKDCQRWLTSTGWGHTAKSACIGCPFHGNAQWRDLRDNHPGEWADAVDFDRRIRKGGASANPLDGEAFLHRSRVPLDLAPIDRITRGEWKDRQLDLFEDGDPDGCSPYGCRSGEPVSLGETA